MKWDRYWVRIVTTALVLCTIPATLASGVTVSGTVMAPGGKAAEDTRIILVELNKSMFVDEDGAFRFEGVPSGFYHIQATAAVSA